MKRLPATLAAKLYRELFASSPEAILLIDAESRRVLQVNAAACQQFGYSPEEFLGLTIADLEASMSAAEIDAQISAAQRDGGAEFEAFHRTKTGDLRRAHVRVEVSRSDGRCVFLVVAHGDTTRRRIDIGLAATGPAGHGLLEIAPVGNWTLDFETGTLTWSREMYDIFGVPTDTFTPTVESLVALIHPDDRDAMRSWIDLTTEGVRQAPMQFRVMRPDGTERSVQGDGEAHFSTDGKPVFMIGTALDLTARMRAVDAIERSEAIFRAVSEATNAAVVTADSAGRIVGWNPAAERVFGYPASEILGEPLTRLVPARLHNEYLRRLGESPPAAGSPSLGQNVETSGLRRDQSEFPAEVAFGGWATPDGPVFTAVVQDMTERTEVRRQLHDSERLLHESHAAGGIGSYDLDITSGRWTSSPILDRVFGIDGAFDRSIDGWVSLIHPQWREPTRRYLAEEVVGKAHRFDMEYQIVRRTDGRTRWVRGLGDLDLDAAGRPIRMIGTITDITDRKQADATLRLQSAALYAAADAIVITDRTGAIEWVNPAFTELTGYTIGESYRRNPRDLLRSGEHPPEFYHDLWETITSGNPWHGVLTNRRRDGSLYTEEQSITPIRDASGAITHFVAIKSDISERLKLESHLRQAQRMESVGQLASGIAHDFNNLLTVINGAAELLLAERSDTDRARDDLLAILHAGERAAALTRQLLAFGRQQVMEPRVMDLNATIGSLEIMLRRLIGDDVLMTTVRAPDLGHVWADPGQIEQVLLNLVVNADDAMPQGGQLEIATQNIGVDAEYAAQHGGGIAPGDYVQLSVSDSGTGMDEATRLRIFEPFFTTKPLGEGTGLGLSTVFGIVQQSRGFIGAYSEPGHGTTIRIRLPRASEAVVAAPQPVAAVRTGGTETILLVEDNDGLRKLTVRLLEPAGYTVLAAASADEALQLLRLDGPPIDLLLTDVVMPGMGGRQLALRLAELRPAARVLYMSGYTGDAIIRRGVLEAEMAFLSKPFSSAALLAKVREVLDRA